MTGTVVPTVFINDVRSLRVMYDIGTAEAPIISGIDGNIGEIESALELKTLTSNPDGLKVLDVDQDGLEDVLIFEKYNPPPVLVRQTQKRKFELIDSPSAQSSLIKDAGLSSIAVVDVDGQAGKELLDQYIRAFRKVAENADEAKKISTASLEKKPDMDWASMQQQESG